MTEGQRSFVPMVEKLTWYVVYTRPRWEKKVAAAIEDYGLESYCPLNKVYRQWSDRRKLVLEPLFKGYVFVNVTDEKKWEVKKVEGVLNYVYWNGQPARVREDEIETIKKFLNEFTDVDIEDAGVKLHSQVTIKRGLLMNYQGLVLEVFGNKAKVRIESMGVQLSAIIEKKNLEPVYK